MNEETRKNISDEVSEFSVPETRFDRQTHTHHMVAGRTTKLTKIPEFFTGRILTPRNPTSAQHQSLLTQVSQNKILLLLEKTPRNQNSDTKNSINCLVDSFTGIATQQRPQAATMLEPASTKTTISAAKNEQFELFEDLFHTMLKMQPEKTEVMKINNFHAHLQKEALHTIRNRSASNKKNLGDVLVVFRRKKCQTRITSYS